MHHPHFSALRVGYRIPWDPFAFGHGPALILRCIACLAALAGVVGAVVVGVPFLVVAVLLRVFGPSGGIGADRHPGLWLAVSTATAVTLLLAVFAIAATFRAGRRAYMRRVFDLVAERERELLDEVERDLSWLDDAVATRPPVG